MIESGRGRSNVNVPFHLPDALEYKFLGYTSEEDGLAEPCVVGLTASKDTEDPLVKARAGSGAGGPWSLVFA